LTFIHIASNATVFFVGIYLVVLMTIGAAEHGIIRRVSVAFHAFIPFTLVFARINREILSIVVKG